MTYDALDRLTARTGFGVADQFAHPGLLTDSTTRSISWNAVARDTIVGSQEAATEMGFYANTRFATNPSAPFYISHYVYDTWSNSDYISGYPNGMFAQVVYNRDTWITSLTGISVAGNTYVEQERDIDQRLTSQTMGGSTMSITHYTRANRPVQVMFDWNPFNAAFRTSYHLA